MSEWQPIETAPKDGTTIIAYRPGQTPHVEGMHWVEYEGLHIAGAWHWSYDGDAPMENPPTHWIPLPKVPHDLRPQALPQAAASASSADPA